MKRKSSRKTSKIIDINLEKFEINTNNAVLDTNSSAISDTEYICELELQIGTYRNVRTKLLYVKRGKAHPCTGTEALYRPYGPYGE